jgi:hypothetical protein
MAFTLSIDTDNAAFCDDDGEPHPGPEIALILVTLATAVVKGIGPDTRDCGPLRDSNGNTVGRWEFVQ